MNCKKLRLWHEIKAQNITCNTVWGLKRKLIYQLTGNVSATILKEAGDFLLNSIYLNYIFLQYIVNKSHVHSNTNNELILLTALFMFSQSIYIKSDIIYNIYVAFLCAIERSCPKKHIKDPHWCTGWHVPSPQRHKGYRLETAPSTNNNHYVFSLRRLVHTYHKKKVRCNLDLMEIVIGTIHIFYFLTFYRPNITMY